jgi:hypothetical protein
MLNYQEKKYSPLDSIIKGYEERGTSKANNEPASDSMKALRERYNADPNSLSPIELLTLGSYEMNAKNEKESQERQKAAKVIQDGHEQERKEDKEMISTNSDEFKQLAEQMAQLQKMFMELNGGGDE